MLHKNGSDFDQEAALKDLIAKFGVIEEPKNPQSPVKSKKKRAADNDGSDNDAPEEDSSPAAKKKPKTEVVEVESNRPIAVAIREMAGIYFQNKDARKGGR